VRNEDQVRYLLLFAICTNRSVAEHDRVLDVTCQGVDQCGQATKGVWGMPRRQKAMKGVEDCDKPGGLVKRELIPGFPNYLAVNP
jgi:hypothetical protein